MKKKQAWKVMGAVLAGTLVFSDAVPLRASASAGTEKSAVQQNETASRTENDTETKTQRAAVYVDLKTGSDTADGTTAETAVKTVEKAQELLAAAAAELQADQKSAGETVTAETAKADQISDAAAEKYLVFVGMDEKELEDYKKKQQKTEFWGKVTDTVFAADEIVVTEAGYEAVLAAEKAKDTVSETPTLAPGESPAPDAAEDDVTPTPGPTEVPDADPTAEPTVTPDADPTAEPTVTPDAEPTVEPTAAPTVEPTVTPEEKPTATPTPEPANGENTGDTPTAVPTPDAEPTATPTATPDQKADDSETPETPAEDPTVTPAQDDPSKEDPTPDDPKTDDANQDNDTKTDVSSDQWKQDENLNDIVKDEIQKENETVKNYDEISNPSDADTADDGYLISDVSLLIQPMAVSLSRSVVSEEETETAAEVQETEPAADDGEEELLAAAEQKSNLRADEMTASAASGVSVLRTTGTILVGPDNYGTNKTSTPTPTAAPSKSSSTSTGNSSNNSGPSNSSFNTGSTKIPQKKTQTTTSIRSIPVNTGDETMVLPLAISSVISAAVMFCMAFLQMQAKRAKSMAAWLEFKKNHPFDEE